MKHVFKLWVESFWVRNVSVAILLVVFEQLFRPDTGIINLAIGVSITLALYVWLVFHNRILLDRYLLRGNYSIYFPCLITGLVYYVLVMYSNSEGGYTKSIWLKGSSLALFNTLMGSLFFFAYKYFKEQQDFARNKIYLFEMEQKYLRNQLSPHFLFNTLNNIYSYSLVESKKTSELILKLSELMRYLIDFNKHKQIELKEEITFIENYIVFERERLEDRCEIIFSKQIENEKLSIEPLLFFPLIENAFKHGTNTMDDCYVYLQVEQKKNQLDVKIKNKIIANDKPSTNSGMENVEKRLQLFYTDKYELKINKSDGEYFVILHIELNSSQ